MAGRISNSSKRFRAYLQLGVSEDSASREPQITPQLRDIMQSLSRQLDDHSPPLPLDPYDYLAASDHPDARKILDKRNLLRAGLRDTPSIEAYCLAAGVSPLRALEIIIASCVRMGAVARSIIAAANQPRMVMKSVEVGLTDEGIQDRILLAKATGFLPSPKAPSTTVNVNASASSNSNTAIVTAPPPEQTIRRLVDRFNEASQRRELPAAAPATLPDRMPMQDAELVEADTDSAEDE